MASLLKAKPGTYAFILRSHLTARIQIGRWGQMDIKPGYYLYVGSAFGPGGVKARVLRHCRSTKSSHWHIDYLRSCLQPRGAWYSYEARHLEHQWAEVLGAMSTMVPIQGFGCSDCKCYTHLFHTIRVPDFTQFAGTAGDSVESWQYRPC